MKSANTTADLIYQLVRELEKLATQECRKEYPSPDDIHFLVSRARQLNGLARTLALRGIIKDA